MKDTTDPSQLPDDYDPQPLTDRWDHPVLRSEFNAWKVIIAPTQQDGFAREHLFVRGLEHYRADNGRFKEDPFMDDVENFGIKAANGVDTNAILHDPWIDPTQPGRLAILYAASAIAMKHSPAYDVPPSKVDYDKYAANAFHANILGALQNHPRDRELQRLAAETVFGRRQEDARGPPPGRIITGIYQLENDRWYFEMPLIHASRHALGRDDHTDDITALIKNNCLYIPYDTLERELETHVLSNRGTAYELRRTYYDMFPESNLQSFLSSTPRITDQIRRIKQANRTQKLYKEGRYPETLRCVLKAVSECPTTLATLDKPITARNVLNAIEWFCEQIPRDADDVTGERHSNIKAYEQHKLDDFDTPEGVTAFLKDHQDHADVTFRQRDHPDPNLFTLNFFDSNIKQIDVETPDDVFELPCVANLEEHFMRNDPVRRPLYFLVRIVLSLENEFEPEEIYRIFERFPWYKEDVTEYQVDYETREGDDVLPVSCRNDNNPSWNQFCIGIENCDYSIWRSLPMKDEIYDDADSSR